MWPQMPTAHIQMDTTGFNWPYPADYRKRGAWLECIPNCMIHDASWHKLAHAEYNVQKMVPLPKMHSGRLSYTKFRGIAISIFT
eukprot:3571390-Amphidinium_carterae.1